MTEENKNNDANFKTVAEMAEAWNISSRRVRDFCLNGRIQGARAEGRTWLIPATAEKPVDGRTLKPSLFSKGVHPVACYDDAAHSGGEKGGFFINKKRNLMNYCPDIKVVDATLRDGGLVNNFAFSDEFVRALYQANIDAGVDYMEFGYRASHKMFDAKEFGKWKFTSEEDLRAIVGDNNTDLKIAIMADAGRCDYKTDILPRKDSVVDMIRIACYVHQIPLAIDMIEDAKSKGYEVSCNLMAVSKVSGCELMAALRMISETDVDVLYLVDSFGHFYPENIADMAKMYVGAMAGKEVGFHGHNNQQLAFANTIEACRWGFNFLDVTVNGMGRGAGNCYTEQILSFLKNPKYSALPIYDFVEKHILPLKASGAVWGYDLPYLLTGVMNSHPSGAIKFLKENRSDYSRFYHELIDLV